MTEIELLHRADDQEIILRMATALEQILQHGMLGQSPTYLSELAKRGRTVGYRQMQKLIESERAA